MEVPVPTPPVEDADMEDSDDDYADMVIDAPSHSLGDNGRPPNPETDEDEAEDEAWEVESSHSDTDSEVLIEEDDDDIVPPSFSFVTPMHPSSEDCSTTKDTVTELPLELEEIQVEDSRVVYGSDSK